MFLLYAMNRSTVQFDRRIQTLDSLFLLNYNIPVDWLQDGAIFYHWRRNADEGKDYPFAAFNKVRRFVAACS